MLILVALDDLYLTQLIPLGHPFQEQSGKQANKGSNSIKKSEGYIES